MNIADGNDSPVRLKFRTDDNGFVHGGDLPAQFFVSSIPQVGGKIQARKRTGLSRP